MVIRKKVVISRIGFLSKELMQFVFGAGNTISKGRVDQRIFLAIICIVTAPAIFGSKPTHIRFHGIAVNINKHSKKHFVTVDRSAVKAILEKMAGPRILVVVPSHKSGFQALEEGR